MMPIMRRKGIGQLPTDATLLKTTETDTDLRLAPDGSGGVTWGSAGDSSPLTTKGDIYTFSTDNARLPIGTDNHVLTADSGEPTGVKWAALSATKKADKLNFDMKFNASNPTYQIDIDADSITMYNTSEEAKTVSDVNVTVDITASGANGLDTGSEASSTWYSIWTVAKEDGTVAGLLHAGGTGVIGDLTFPSGYTYARWHGWARNDSSSDFLFGHWFNHEAFWYDDNIQVYGAAAPTTYTDLDVSDECPPKTETVMINIWSASLWQKRLRRNGSVYGERPYHISTQSHAVPDVDENQIFEWRATSAVNTQIYVRGYWLDGV